MKVRIRKGLLKISAWFAIAGLGIFGSTTVASANSTQFWNSSTALDGAPQGVYLGSGTASDYFTIDNTVATASGMNSAQLVDAGSPAGTGNSAIQISKAGVTQSWGSIWSKQQSFDLNKKETASMWIYASGERASSVGDGMAFVLQNGGTNVYSGPGESMGVWGVPDSLFAKTDLANTAIKNSWALEFDTFPNGSVPTQATYDTLDVLQLGPKGNPTWDFSGQNPSSFDVKGDTPGAQTPITNTHIASNYPGDNGTYTETSVLANGKKNFLNGVRSWTGTFYYYSLKHLGFLDEGPTGGNGNLSDHRWHHITVDYTPPTTTGGNGSMTYTYNDKNPDTGLPQASTDYATVPINLSKFNLASGQSKVRWGFTGSTGEATENNLVIFDQLPGQAQTEATAKLEFSEDPTADPSKTTMTDVDSGGSIPGDSPIKLTYTLGRTGGDEDWKSVNANLAIPKDLNITSGTIDYPDSSYKDSHENKVDVSKIVDSSDGTSQSLAVPLADGGLTMSDTQHATITLYGTAKNVATDATGIAENEQTSYFTGANATSSAKTPNFKIMPKVNAKLAMDIFKDIYSILKVNYQSGQPAEVVGTAKPLDNKIKMEDITIHPSINGVSQDAVNMADIVAPQVPGIYYFDYKVPNDKLQPGDNTISFYATYGSGADEVKSTTVNVTVTAGTIGFGHTSGDMTFKPTTLNGIGSKVIDRSNDWSLDVDSSLIGSNSTWSVTAKTTGMVADDTAVSTPLDGSLIYTDATGTDKVLNDSNAPIIASGKVNGTNFSTNIAKDWTNDTGIRLKVNSGAVEGTYHGEIDWTVAIVPDTTK